MFYIVIVLFNMLFSCKLIDDSHLNKKDKDELKVSSSVNAPKVNEAKSRVNSLFAKIDSKTGKLQGDLVLRMDYFAPINEIGQSALLTCHKYLAIDKIIGEYSCQSFIDNSKANKEVAKLLTGHLTQKCFNGATKGQLNNSQEIIITNCKIVELRWKNLPNNLHLELK